MTKARFALMKKAGIIKPGDSKSEAAVKMSLVETVGRAALTATVTFAVGWALKRMFEQSVEQSVPQSQPRVKPSSAGGGIPAAYRAPARRLPPDDRP